VTVSNRIHNCAIVVVVDLSSVDLVADVLFCQLSALDNRFVGTIASNKGVHDVVANLQSFMLLPRVF